MLPSPDQLREYTGSGEPLEAIYPATVVERSSRTSVALGLTDRRLLYVSEKGLFGTVEYDAISGLRGRPQLTRTYCLDDYRLVLGAGGVASLLGFAAVLAVASTLLVPFLLLAAVCGLVTAEYLRRHGADVERDGDAGLRERIDNFDLGETLRRLRSDSTGRADPYQLLLVGSALLAIASFVSIILLASNWVVLGTALFVGGVGLVDYGYRHRDGFDGFAVVRHREIAVNVRTADDSTLRFRTDPSNDLCKEVSRLAVGEFERATR